MDARSGIYTPRGVQYIGRPERKPEPGPEAAPAAFNLDELIGMVNAALTQSRLGVTMSQREEAIRTAIGASLEILHGTAVSLGEAHNDLVDRFNELLRDHVELKTAHFALQQERAAVDREIQR